MHSPKELRKGVISRIFVILLFRKDALQVFAMEFEYSTYRNRNGVFYHPSINVTFQYKAERLPYESALVDTGSDFVILPMEIAERIGAEPDLEQVTELNCACGGSFKSYTSRHPIKIIVDHEGFRPKHWETFVQFVDAKVTVLLGQRGFLDRLDATFYGKQHIMKLSPN